VLKDPEIKKKVQVYYKKAFDEVVGPRYASKPAPAGVGPRPLQAPARGRRVPDGPLPRGAGVDRRLPRGRAQSTRSAGSSIYPAVQNMLLAARALGLGSTLTTRHIGYEKEVDAAMASVRLPLYAILPIGLPDGPLRAGRPGAAFRRSSISTAGGSPIPGFSNRRSDERDHTNRRGKPRLVGINHIAIEVGDIEQALDFYGKIFDFTLRDKRPGNASCELGDQFINMMQTADPHEDRAAISGSSSTIVRACALGSKPPAASCCRGGFSTFSTLGHRVEVVE